MYEHIPAIMRKAAERMLSAHDIDRAVTVKPGDANFVTAYDVAVQNELCQALGALLPDAVLIGEEAENNAMDKLASSLALIIDPIDGTTNFIHNYRHSAISVGLCDHGTMVYGAIYNPYTDDLYHAQRGCGAFVCIGGTREQRISVSERPLSQSLVGYGTSPYYRDEFSEKTFRAAHQLFLASHDVRRSGSAALDLSSVACGMLDAFFEYRLSPWDFAAGSLLIEEAGGRITQMDGSPLRFDAPCSVLAGNPAAYEQIRARQLF